MCGGSPLIVLGFDVDSGIVVLVVGEFTQERRYYFYSRSPLWIFVWFFKLFPVCLVVGENTQVGVVDYYSRSPLSEPV